MFRTYLHFRSAEFNTEWGVNDGWGFGLGANFNRHLGAELALDTYERDLREEDLGRVGEVSVFSIVPQLRLRYPFANNKWTVYLLGGVGAGYLQFNDRKPGAFGAEIEADGTRPILAVGAGIEYFVTDNVAFNLEGKYLWVQNLDATIEGRRQSLDLSAPLVTMGVRAYFQENWPRPLVEQEEATPDRAYFGVRYGGSVLTDGEIASGIKLRPEVSAHWNKVNDFAGLTLGANFGEFWGVELAMDFTEYTLALDEFGPVGEYSVYSVVPHLRLRLPLYGGRWVPYIMAGAGFIYAESNDRKPAGRDLQISEEGFHPAISAGTGVEYFVARNFCINTDVRWTYTWDHRFDIAGGSSGRGDFSMINFYLGFRLYLLEF